MKIIRIAFIVLVVAVSLLSLAAGVAKLVMAEPEVAFFDALGVDPRWMIALGLLQVSGAVLVIFKRMRIVAGLLMAAGFAVSALMILLSGNTGFALISALPVVLALLVAFGALRIR
ncbi:hypothetical protein [Hyphobacterium sp.]|uniref:hypothetical protein n=1 Tax=Hyphobacterium sp. TaxID=2004662 RepID=UPI003B521E06